MENEKEYRINAYIEAIQKNGLPNSYMETGDPMKRVLEDLAFINRGPLQLGESNEYWEGWEKRWNGG